MMNLNRSMTPRLLATALASLSLAACGGGGGGDPVASSPPVTPTPPTTPAAPPPYTLSPSPLTAKYVAGYPVTISATATQSTTFVGIVYVKLSADSGAIDSAKATPNPDGSLAVAVATSATVAPGHYAGNVTVDVCKDANCTAELDGAPFKVPYAIDVVSPDGGVATTTLSPIAPLAGAGDWSGYQGNAAHTGMVPVTLNPSAFTVRWKYEVPAVSGRQMTISDVATGNGQLYFSTGPYWDSSQNGHELFALKESDGSQAWLHDFGNLVYATTNPPAFANGKVYLSAGSQQSTAMFAFDAANGAQLFSTPTESQWEHYLAPVVFGGSVYSDGGEYGGMYAFDAGTGKQQWFATQPQIDGWTPAVDATRTYVYLQNQLRVNDRQSGAPVVQIAGSDSGWPTGFTPLLGAQNSVVVAAASALMDFDTGSNAVRWSVGGNFDAGPAYADKLVYALKDKPLTLEARNETDGTLAWSWMPPATAQRWSGNVLLTNNLVFVSTDGATYAIDRTTHAQVWSVPFGGKLALSANGILYINSLSSILAVNLK